MDSNQKFENASNSEFLDSEFNEPDSVSGVYKKNVFPADNKHTKSEKYREADLEVTSVNHGSDLENSKGTSERRIPQSETVSTACGQQYAFVSSSHDGKFVSKSEQDELNSFRTVSSYSTLKIKCIGSQNLEFERTSKTERLDSTSNLIPNLEDSLNPKLSEICEVDDSSMYLEGLSRVVDNSIVDSEKDSYWTLNRGVDFHAFHTGRYHHSSGILRSNRTDGIVDGYFSSQDTHFSSQDKPQRKFNSYYPATCVPNNCYSESVQRVNASNPPESFETFDFGYNQFVKSPAECTNVMVRRKQTMTPQHKHISTKNEVSFSWSETNKRHGVFSCLTDGSVSSSFVHPYLRNHYVHDLRTPVSIQDTLLIILKILSFPDEYGLRTPFPLTSLYSRIRAMYRDSSSYVTALKFIKISVICDIIKTFVSVCSVTHGIELMSQNETIKTDILCSQTKFNDGPQGATCLIKNSGLVYQNSLPILPKVFLTSSIEEKCLNNPSFKRDTEDLIGEDPTKCSAQSEHENTAYVAASCVWDTIHSSFQNTNFLSVSPPLIVKVVSNYCLFVTFVDNLHLFQLYQHISSLFPPTDTVSEENHHLAHPSRFVNTARFQCRAENRKRKNLPKKEESGHSNTAEGLEQLLSQPTAKEQKALSATYELDKLLTTPTAAERLKVDVFRSKNKTGIIKEICDHGTATDCMTYNSGSLCCKVHFRRIILAHTDIALGDCSYLDTCRHIETCKFVHYEVDTAVGNKNRQATLSKKQIRRDFNPHDIGAVADIVIRNISPQWITCDIRTFDLSIFKDMVKIVMADPPWDIHMYLPYGTMTDQEMRQLRVDQIQSEGLLFVWVTGRAMELARECMEIWGYKRVDEIVWVKTNQLHRLIRTGRTGHWLNHSKEHCLVGIKGNPEINRMLDCDVIVSEVRETSRKPDEIYRIIERLAPQCMKLELFGRPNNLRNNWITLGNQLVGVSLCEPTLISRYNTAASSLGLQEIQQ